MSPYLGILTCMTMCFATFGGFRFLLHARGIDYIQYFWITALYFFSAAAVTMLVFGSRMLEIARDFSWTPVVMLFFCMAALLAIHIVVPRLVAAPEAYFNTYPDRYYLRIDWRRFISKSADILAQQVFIILIVLFLRDAGLSLLQIPLVFFVLFGILHIPLIVSESGIWRWVFSGIVVVFSFGFPVLILTVHYGFVYTYLLHWLFYIVMSLSFWLCARRIPAWHEA